jgi:hypothetical protein
LDLGFQKRERAECFQRGKKTVSVAGKKEGSI